ncbi:sulfite exporter TauE/SafE family protein [Streptomyces sp. CB01881]|uniref:sulfite exporter TauE/SafE family protein n=1 Tax=Streptomyces sp. CB01881 TaxID=2078691 RepID=UPI000CDC44AB|nr:sulfite exporter TauE/SafE family protein [Streptomyces sp. CB01881]AUY48381.1 integral membrane family protein [Streptomyces sp. CB01881]TYC76870.1 sulfite exporter TauE/SafE family protein [Streptomyces sp. CB01881]
MTTLVLALAAGAVVGLALGGLGGGGSMLAVPALIYLLGFSPAHAGTAALLIVAVTSLTGLLAHARAGRVRWRTGLLFAAAGLPTATVAGTLSAHLPAALLTAGFAVLAALAAWRMLAGRRETSGPAVAGSAVAAPAVAATARAATTVPDPAVAANRWAVTGEAVVTGESAAGVKPTGLRAVTTGAGLGAVTGLLGVGGGFLAVPALVSVLALTMAEAVGTSLLVISASALAALLPRLGATGSLDWAVVAPFTAAAVLGAWDGKRLADRLSGRALQSAFAVALSAVAALMLADALS